jgi:DNA polymerase III delta subunit
MHSKWQIWDYFSSFQKDYLGSFNGVLALNSFDPLCLKLMKDFLVRGSGGRIIHHKLAGEVSRNWIEEEFQTLSLFGGSDCFFIHQAQDLKADILDLLSKLDLTDRFVILSYEADGVSWKKLVKDGAIATLVIDPPRFWELNKLLDFVANYLRLPLSYDAKTWILDALENNLSVFYNTCTVLKLNLPDAKEVSVADVKSLFTLDKLDQFAMASLFTRKKFSDFYDRLVQLEGDFDKMRGFFNFMQSHLIKLADTSYLAFKPRLTQYDKDLQSTAKLWKSEEIIREIQRFNEWEVRSKKKDNFLWNELRQIHLRVLPKP